MHANKNIMNNRWMPQNTICGYMLVSAFYGELASIRDVSKSHLN